LEVLSIKSVFPTGLNDSLKLAFPNINSIIKPEFIPESTKLNGHWIAGFTQSDGSFGLNYYKAPAMKLGFSCKPSVRKHERDLIVLKRILEGTTLRSRVVPWGLGNLHNTSKIRKEWTITVSNNSHLVNIIIPFYKEYPIFGAKHEDLLDFQKGVLIVKNKNHLTEEGLNEIKNLSSGMNSFRKS